MHVHGLVEQSDRMGKKGRIKRFIRKFIPFMIGVMVIFALLHNFNMKEIMDVVRSVPTYMIVVIILLHLLLLILGAFKWHIMLREISDGYNFSLIFKIHIAGICVDNITPGAKMGGEGVRLYFMRNFLGVDYGSVAGILALDKVVTIFSFIVMCIPAIVWQIGMFSGTSITIWYVVVSLFLAFFIITVVVFMMKLDNSNRRHTSTKFSKIKLFFTKARSSFKNIFYNSKKLFVLTLLSFILWAFYPLKLCILASSIGMDISFKGLASASMLAYLIGMLPLTPGGLGLYDGVMSTMLLSFGVSRTDIGALVILYRLTTHFFSLIFGGVAAIDLFKVIHNDG